MEGASSPRNHHQPSSLTVAVMGGTGMQGQGVIDYLLDEGGLAPHQIRTLTRNASSPPALALSSKGIQVIQGPNTVDNWKRLFEGADSLFALTFTDFEDPYGEVRRGKELVDVILYESPSLQHVVFSGGERTAVPSLNAKADIETYARGEIEKQHTTTIQFTFLHTSFFYENLIYKNHQRRFRRTKDGKFVFTLPLDPRKEISMIGARDIGCIAGHILLTKRPTCVAPNTTIGMTSLPIVGDLVSPNRFLLALKKVLPNYQFEYNQTDFEALRQKMGDAQAKLVMEMYDTYYQKGADKAVAREQIVSTKALYPNIMSLERWISLHVTPILLQQEAE